MPNDNIRTGGRKQAIVIFRGLVAITLLVSFVAISTSGLMMFVVNKPSFTIQMHAVHKVFGLVLIAAMSSHLVLNLQPLQRHLKSSTAGLYCAVLVALMTGLYGLTLTKGVPPNIASELDSLARQVDP